MSATHTVTDYSASFDDRITELFIGFPAKVLSRITGRSPATLTDCRYGRSKYRATDLVAAMAASEELRLDVEKLVNERRALLGK